jgi:hypothetical protein
MENLVGGGVFGFGFALLRKCRMSAEEWVDGGMVEGWVDGWAEREGKGGYRFMKLVKYKIKEKNYAVFYFAGKRIFFYVCDVITWEKQKKSSAILLLLCVCLSLSLFPDASLISPCALSSLQASPLGYSFPSYGFLPA